jgi:DNA helicase II / ATP-dependent DNA helicase PcrA
MKFYADLHIHSPYSRATSKELAPENIALWAGLKGIQVVGTGDCVHPVWLKELKRKLEPAEEGLFRLKPEYEKKRLALATPSCQGEVRFLLSTEVANIYKRADKVRKIHNVIFAPSFAAAEKIQAQLAKIGNIKSDGRPILGLDSRDLLEIVLESDPLSFLVPAHIWTPWFSVLGSKGGFDHVRDCFVDLTEKIFAVETGLSSDPAMNWRLSQLDPYVMISNSDAHSPAKLGREANIFDTELSYPAIYRALADPKDKGFVGTVEFFPEEGKYHYDGHRSCQTRMHPEETIKQQGLCPVCGKPVTVGVMARVQELADHPDGRKAPRARPYYSLIPLAEIIAEARGVGANSGQVAGVYQDMLAKLGPELTILRETPLADIRRAAGALVAEGVRRTRTGEVHIEAGYDGEYGVIKIFDEKERAQEENQLKLF